MTVIRKPPKTKSFNLLEQRSRFDWLPFVILLILLLILFFSWQTTTKIDRIENNQPYIYLQKTNGTVDKGVSANNLERSDATVKAFVEDWLTLAYTWVLDDPNLFVRAEEENYPLPLYVASFALKPIYREAYLNSIAKKYQNKFPFQSYIAGKQQSKVLIFEEPIIKPIEAGIWEVAVIAYRTHSVGTEVIAQEKFNHVITVRAIKPSNKRLKSQKDSLLGEMMSDMQDRGLQIIQITQF